MASVELSDVDHDAGKVVPAWRAGGVGGTGVVRIGRGETLAAFVVSGSEGGHVELEGEVELCIELLGFLFLVRFLISLR